MLQTCSISIDLELFSGHQANVRSSVSSVFDDVKCSTIHQLMTNFIVCCLVLRAFLTVGGKNFAA